MNEKAAGEEGYTPNGFKVDKYIDHNGDALKDDALALRKFVAEKPTIDNLKFLGWTTKKLDKNVVQTILGETISGDLTADQVSKAFNKLQKDNKIAKTADQVNGTEACIFNDESPITKATTVYAVYGPPKSAVFNPTQTYDETNDKQYIEAKLKDGETQPTDATYKLVKKNSDGTYTPVENLTSKEVDGKTVFDITDLTSDKFDPNADYYIETTETGKRSSYSDTPIKIDKVAPTITKDNGKNFTVVQDHYGYQVKISATANDQAGILRVYAETDKDGGYYKQEASETTANLTESIQNQLGVQKKFTVTAVDKFGNKTEVTETVEPKAATLSLKAERPLDGTDFIYVTTTAGANLEIKVINKDNTEVLTMTHIQGAASEEIKLVKDGSPFKLTKGQKIKITATSGNQTAKLTIRVR